MTPEKFVASIQKNVLEAATEATVATLEHPPGRRPEKNLIEASRWFGTLSDQDRATLRRVLNMAAHHAVFGFLAVLDGSRVIEDDAEKGEFRLIFRKGGHEWEINIPNGTPLHDILNQQLGDRNM
ncbi:hypothetical protein [Sorangium cellulosum]|uniref:hypothetical protein n=1 Tax=Sorangium cellulosum TaxID=56 RepID=UPI0011DCEB46|nr:hypothetical protein [Sorangium cellulosum]